MAMAAQRVLARGAASGLRLDPSAVAVALRCLATTTTSFERRVAIDIGSGMVTMGVADVPLAPGAAAVMLPLTERERQTVVGLKGDLESRDNTTGGFRPEAVSRLKQTLRSMLAL